jgi:nucleoside-diphosphate-sugar epimerase
LKALLIGGTGPTGPLILDGLVKRGYDTVLLHRGTHEVELPHEVEHIHVDPHFEDSLASGLVGRKFDLVVATYGRLRFLPNVLKNKTKRLVTIGGTAYGDIGGRSADEHAPRDMANGMVRRIMETEDVLMKAHDEGIFSLTNLRYPNLFGPRQLAPREWSIIRRIMDGRKVIPVLERGLLLESKAYNANAANAVLIAVDHPAAAAGQHYNVADLETISDLERVKVIARIMKAEIDIASLPLAGGAPAYWWAAGRDASFARQGRQPNMFHKIVSSDKIRRELGYVDLVDFVTAMNNTVAWYLENPLPEGGEQEKNLGDPFDYAAEDAYFREIERSYEATRAIPFSGVTTQHPYAHPTKPAEHKEQP